MSVLSASALETKQFLYFGEKRMHEKNFTIIGNHKNKTAVERAAETIFTGCGLLAVIAVLSITLYMIISGTPALFKVGILDILFGTVWKPTADPASFGILYVILTSIIGTFLAILIGVPIGVFTASFLADCLIKPSANLLSSTFIIYILPNQPRTL